MKKAMATILAMALTLGLLGFSSPAWAVNAPVPTGKADQRQETEAKITKKKAKRHKFHRKHFRKHGSNNRKDALATRIPQGS